MVQLRLPEQLLAAALTAVVAVGLMSIPVVRPSAMPPVPVATPAAAVPAQPPALGLQPAPHEAHAAPAPQQVQQPAGAPPRAATPPAPVRRQEQDRVEQALLSLGYPWQELGYAIRFAPASRGLLGLADPVTRTITVFVRPGQSVQSLRVVLAHELGHALDDVTGTDAQRARYLELRGIAPGTPWFPCPGCDDVASPAGDFAEVFAAWLVGPSHFRSLLGPPPDDAQLAQLAQLFAPPSARTTTQGAPAPVDSPPPAPRPSSSPKPGLLDVLPG